MLAGKWLGAPGGDQNPAGYASRTWGAEWWHRLGHVPLWEPMLFGGMPYVGAGHGDIFYPTSFLRLILPVDTVINLGFVLHYILAGLFTYWLLRRLHVSWTGSVIGGIAYQLSGLLASYPSPGHDGKLFGSAALPLALLALVMALRDKRWEGYAVLAIAVAMSLLGHFQIAYYVLVAAGLFAVYLTFAENSSEPGAQRYVRLVFALGAVLLGFGLAAIQLLPFIQYIPFSPRAQGYHGFEGSTSYAIPWVHVPEFFLKNFVGSRETYWGSNPLKYHSEYLGLPIVALAALGAFSKDRRRLVLWLGGIGLLFLLISLGASTPFYRVFWAIMPMIKKTRAPGMAFFAVAFVVSGDLFLNARGFWIYSPDPKQDWFRPDPVTNRIKQTTPPYRVFDPDVYGGDALMAFDIPQVLGYHGNEMRYYDELLDRDEGWANLQYVRFWDLLAIRYVILPVRGRNDSIPGYRRILDSVPTAAGG